MPFRSFTPGWLAREMTSQALRQKTRQNIKARDPEIEQRAADLESAAFSWRRRHGTDPHTDERFQFFSEGYIAALKDRDCH